MVKGENFNKRASKLALMEKKGMDVVFEGDRISLNGVLYHPELKSSGKFHEIPNAHIYFVHGLSGRWVDYKSLLIPLSEKYNVLAYDQRGHGSSPGIYTPERAASDLEKIIECEEGNLVGLVGHSVGCRTVVEVAKRFEDKGKPLNGVYLLQPCLGADYFGAFRKNLFKTASTLYPLLSPLDLFLTAVPFVRRALGMHQVFPLYTVGAISKSKSEDINRMRTPAGYILADKDPLLGTTDYKHYLYLLRILDDLFPVNKFLVSGKIEPWNESFAAIGLNHCFNYGGQTPFLKDEPNKKSNLIVDCVSTFFDVVFEKH